MGSPRRTGTRMLVLCAMLVVAAVPAARPSGAESSAAAITLSKTHGPPTAPFAVSGTGFDAAQAGSTRTDELGSFVGVFVRVPADALPGPHVVKGIERIRPGVDPRARFVVPTDWQ